MSVTLESSICLWVLSLEVFLISESSPHLETR